MGWFRLYEEAIDDPKVQKLPDKMFKTWVNLLCLASRHGGKLPDTDLELAFSLRVSEKEAHARVSYLISAGLLDTDGETITPHNWNGRQYQSDNSSNRVKAFRERQRNGRVTASETPPDTEQSRAEADAEALPPEALAQKVAAELCLAGPTWILAIEGAIKFLVKFEGKTNNQAVEFLIARAREEIAVGRPPATFWFTDRKWVKPKEESNEEAKPRASHIDADCPACNGTGFKPAGARGRMAPCDCRKRLAKKPEAKT